MEKKAQMDLGKAPGIVLIVGLVFLTMATLAFMGEKYGSAIDQENIAATAINETLTTVTETGENFAVFGYEDVICTLNKVTNASGYVIAAANYTQTNCNLKTKAATTFGNNTNWLVSYGYVYTAETVASNLTTDLNTELDNNSSIAGIILTISLVGIVLSILIGVFLSFRKPTI